MALYDIINSYINSLTQDKLTLIKMKENPELRKLAVFINGGISSMTKKYIETLNENLANYSKNKYIVGNKEIIPDDEQKEIIHAPINHNIRVIASAGCGKTTTITARVKYLLDNFVLPNKILVLTFNVEAKNNLIKALNNMVGFDIKLEIKTIDAFCHKLQKDFMDTNKMNTFYSLTELCNNGLSIMKQYASEICSNYEYVFFDEAQDMNEEQFEILRYFVANKCYLTVIADDSQNIYAFRGSSNYFIINFDKLVPNTLTYKITKNYRSTKFICDLANKSISHNTERIDKQMIAHRQHDKINNIYLSIAKSSKEKINKIIEKIKYYVDTLKFSYGQIAILARNTHPLKEIETILEKEQLPYVSLITEPNSTDYKQIIQENKIVLSTIHRTKGLEWEVCFLIGLCDSHFPTHLNNGLKYIEEERRLFYVAITRARTYLHFCANINELPLSRFIEEILDNIDETNRENVNENYFFRDDKNKTITTYSVTKIIELLNGKMIEQMREQKIIPEFELHTINIFEKKIPVCENIKNNNFESDFGIYCDIYLTRQLNINNKEEIRDIYTETILNKNEEENKELYTYICKNDNNDKEINKKLNNIFSFNFGSNDSTYPEFIIKKVKEAYTNYINSKLQNNEILDDIYTISLCQKFYGERRRLIYRNIKQLFDENEEIIERLNDYAMKLKHKKIKCKITMKHLYKINKTPICLVGELDYVNITDNCLVDIKCSESDFKLEWLIQLLLYYSLCKSNNVEIEINKVAIMNIVTGKYYEINIHNYEYTRLLTFVETIIKDNIEGKRETYNENIDITMMLKNIKNHVNQKPDVKKTVIKINKHQERNGYIVMDVENNTCNNDIVQIAYIMFDNNNKELKRVNKYVKNRIIDQRASLLTNITNDILVKKGYEFNDIIQELYNDLAQVKILVGHNIMTDISKLNKNIEKYNIELSYNPFDEISIKDTMNMYKKRIKLKTMYEEMFSDTVIEYHNALCDVECTAKCYMVMNV